MNRRLLPLYLVGSVLAGTLLSGCVLRTRGYVGTAVVVDATPPPPRRVVVYERPGYVWVEGHWAWNGYDWVWVDGYWVAERPGYTYVQGYWERRGGRHVYVKGRWVARGRAAPARTRGGGVVVRDHRGGPKNVRVKAKPAKPTRSHPKKVKVRDHRRD